MSALSGSPRTLEGSPPRLFKLLGAVLGGEVLAAVTLWIASIILTIIGLVPIGGAQQWVWLPWQIDGVWALVGAIGWGYLVCTLVAMLVTDGIARRGFERPDATWMRLSIAISGYGAMAIGHTAAAHIAAAVVAGAVAIRLLAFTREGAARRWRWRLTGREQLLTGLIAALIGFSYSGLHPFAADGSGGSGTGPFNARVGHGSEVDVGLSSSRLSTQITGVTLTGPGAAHFRVFSVVVNGNGEPETVIPNQLRSQPAAHEYGGYVWHATRLPLEVHAGHAIWITAQVRLTSCADITVTTLKLRYRVIGISTSESIPLQQPLNLRCTS